MSERKARKTRKEIRGSGFVQLGTLGKKPVFGSPELLPYIEGLRARIAELEKDDGNCFGCEYQDETQTCTHEGKDGELCSYIAGGKNFYKRKGGK